MTTLQLKDLDIFDEKKFLVSLENQQDQIKQYKDAIQIAYTCLDNSFKEGFSVKDLVAKRAWFVDQILKIAWQQIKIPDSLALVAVGGFGRGELHPYSDIDLMILTRGRIDKKTTVQIEQFLTFLWDIGLEVGHSVRTVKECTKLARADITIATNIMESRLLTGCEELYEKMREATSPARIWKPDKFFTAKSHEQSARHQKFNNTEHHLEPNVKECPGGLRDIQMIGWVAKRHFGGNTLRDLVKHKFLDKEEFLLLDNGQTILWQIRYALHVLTGRSEDRLLFAYQHDIAEMLGFHGEGNKGVEEFMKLYYQTVTELNRLNEMLLQHFHEAIILANKKDKIKPLNKRFRIRNNYIEVTGKQVFEKYPFALLEIFLLIQQNPSIKGVRASTIRLVRQYSELINKKFRNDIRHRSLFMEIIRQPRFVGHELRRMHRYGILKQYLPAFAKIEGLMQFDLFHVYTVDEHILFVVRNMRLFGLPEYREKFSLCNEVLRKLPKLELLYLAGLFHDIAKGRGGDHSELGAKDAYDFCKLHDLSEFDSKLVAWLVNNHLLMSKTAQREDINDPEIINNFAGKTGGQIYLNYLYVMTVADINATNPTLWNEWKAVLLSDLYNKTLRAIRRGLENPIEKQQLISETREQAASLVKKYDENKKIINEFWNGLDDEYFIRHSAEEIAWHTNSITRQPDTDIPLIEIREAATRGGTGIFVYMKDRKYIFAATTQALGRSRLNIVDARIITSRAGYTLDTYIVLEENGERIKGHNRRNEIKVKLRQALETTQFTLSPFTRKQSRRSKPFTVPTRVLFSEDKINNRTIMEVTGNDHPGFLSRVAAALVNNEIRLQGAKIATYGLRVEDIFFITDKNNNMIKDETRFKKLENDVIQNLEF